MSEQFLKNKLPEIRCSKDKHFFDLMTKEKENDCAHTICEQISTEQLVKTEFMAYLEESVDDPEYFTISFPLRTFPKISIFNFRIKVFRS